MYIYFRFFDFFEGDCEQDTAVSSFCRHQAEHVRKKVCQRTDFEGERGDVGDAERSLPLNVSLSAPALGGARVAPFVLGDSGVVGRAGVDGEGTACAGAGEPGAGGAWTTSCGSGNLPYLSSAWPSISFDAATAEDAWAHRLRLG